MPSLIGTAAPCATAILQDVLVSTQEESIRLCLNGVKEGSEAITSGYATFSGRLKANFQDAPENDQDGAIDGLLAFENSKVRFDISRPGWVVDKSWEKEWHVELPDGRESEARRILAAEMIKGAITKRYSDNGSQVAVWSSDQAMLTVARPADLVDRRFTEYIVFRCPTLFDPFSIGRGWTLDHILSRFDTDFDSSSASVTQRGAIWTINWRSADGGEVSRWLLDVDTDNGFTPVRYRCESTRVEHEHDPSKWIPEWENRTTWKQDSGVFVPVHVERLRFMGPNSRLSEEVVLDLTWELVNSAVVESVFDYADFEVPDEVAIQDTSSGETIWIRDAPGIATETVPLSSRSASSLIAVNLMVLAVALLWVAGRLWRRRLRIANLCD